MARAALGATAPKRTTLDAMLTLARFGAGRVVLHLLAMLGDREFRFHAAGILREIVSR